MNDSFQGKYGQTIPYNTPQPGIAQAADTPPNPETPRRPVMSPPILAIAEIYITRYKWMIAGFFALHFLYLLYLQTRSDVADNSRLRVTSDLFVFVGALVCVLICAFAIWKLRTMEKTSNVLVRRAWLAVTFLGCAAAAYAIGQAIWTWYEAVYPTSSFPFPATYDFFYLAVYPFSWAGISMLVPRGGTVAGRTRLLLDAATAVLSVLAISWYFILGPTIATLTGSALEKTVALAYPIGDLSLCIAAAILLFGPAGTTSLNATLRQLSIGVTLLAVTDSLYGYFQLQGVYHTGFLQDIGWPLSWLFIGWAVLLYLNDLVQLSSERRPPELTARSKQLNTAGATVRAIGPVMLALATCGLLLLAVALRNTAPLIQVVIVCAALFLLPLVRQALTLVDNQLLNDRLKIALNQSQQAFQESQQELLTTSSRAEQYDELRTSIEHLQEVHAQLAHGDMSARAKVQGPLSPVAQSLNLLIERMSRWAQFQQQNRILENESKLLAHEIEQMSEGQIPSRAPINPSPFSTGVALIAITRLQSRLQLRFRRLFEILDVLNRRTSTLNSIINQAKRENGHTSFSQQSLEQVLVQVEKGLANNQNLIMELQQQAHIFLPPAEASQVTSSIKNVYNASKE